MDAIRFGDNNVISALQKISGGAGCDVAAVPTAADADSRIIVKTVGIRQATDEQRRTASETRLKGLTIALGIQSGSWPCGQ